MVTEDNFRPHLVLFSPGNKIYTLGLTAGFETNLDMNTERKRAKYQSLVQTLKSKYTDTKFAKLSTSFLGCSCLSGSSFIEMYDALAVVMGH